MVVAKVNVPPGMPHLQLLQAMEMAAEWPGLDLEEVPAQELCHVAGAAVVGAAVADAAVEVVSAEVVPGQRVGPEPVASALAPAGPVVLVVLVELAVPAVPVAYVASVEHVEHAGHVDQVDQVDQVDHAVHAVHAVHAGRVGRAEHTGLACVAAIAVGFERVAAEQPISAGRARAGRAVEEASAHSAVDMASPI